jgi:dolichyl-phosphate beta-glucosyltransferase
MADNRILTSIVIPCYNGEALIGQTLSLLTEYCERALPDHEILVVDDGSTDNTAAIVQEDFPSVRLISLEKNVGKGQAVREGILSATGDLRLFMDADAPFDLEILETFVRYLDFKEFEMVIGSRTHGNYEIYTKRTHLRRVASSIMSMFISRIVLTGFRDTQCGLKGFRADAAEYLFREGVITGFAFDIELLYLAFKNDFDVKRIPVSLVRNDYSTVSVLRHGSRMLRDVFRIVFRYYLGIYQPYGERFYGPRSL